MRNKIYGLRDTKIGEYVRIYIEDNHVEAARQMQYAVMQQDNKIAQYPDEHEIHYLGEIESITGKVTPVAPECIVNGIQARSQAIERIKKMSPEPDHRAAVGAMVERLEKGIQKAKR